MRLFIHSIIVFFGTLLAAALVALGEPAEAVVRMTAEVQPDVVVGLLGLEP